MSGSPGGTLAVSPPSPPGGSIGTPTLRGTCSNTVPSLRTTIVTAPPQRSLRLIHNPTDRKQGDCRRIDPARPTATPRHATH